MARLTLESVDSGALARLAPRHIVARGIEYFQRGAVLGLDRKRGGLAARVAGSRREPYAVSIRDDLETPGAIECSCPYGEDYGTCKHAIAVLLSWIVQRGAARFRRPGSAPAAIARPPAARPPQPGRADPGSRPPVHDEFLGPLQGPWYGDPLRELWLSWFPRGAALSGEADLREAGPDLQLRLTSPDGREAILVLPGARVPDLLGHLRANPSIRWTDRAKELTALAAPLLPELEADFDEAGNLVLRPQYRTPGGAKPARVYSTAEVAGARLSDEWIWTGDGYRRVERPPRALAAYFEEGRPRAIEGEAIPRFLLHEYPRLARQPEFRPSARVAAAQVLPPPSLAAVRVEGDQDDWLWLDPGYRVGSHRLSLADLLAMQGKGEYVRLGDDWMVVPDLGTLVPWRRAGGAIQGGRVRLPKLGYLRARAELGQDVAVQVSEPVRRFEAEIDRIRPPRPGPEVRGLRGALRPYQRAGYDWLWFLRESGLHGVLADEMGLGKTHQAMALLLAAREAGASGPSLIVCPTSVLDHWEAKILAHAPDLKPLRHHGLRRPPLPPDGLPPVVLTTYAILARDLEALARIAWDTVVLDEAQKIKNPATKTARACRALRARHRLALTGTPIENRLTELWAIFDFLMPGYLGSREDFRQRYATPIGNGGDAGAAATLRRVIHPFKLRRLKADVLADLPPKVEDVRTCAMSPAQAALYRAVVERQGAPLVADLRRPDRPVDYLHILAVLTRLKRICDHPRLVLERGRGHHLTSGKFDLFAELMEEALEGEAKIVVFSQYLEMLDLIEGWLAARGVGFASLRGATRDRGRVIRRFQEDPACRVFAGSLLAGGLGIDLTAASIVIHYDRWWNAAREDQATDRVHRIGQRRGVQVLKLVTRGSLEEKIDRMIEAKRELADAIVESDDATLKALSRDELIDLLTCAP
jgi:superfamily II DNA or RNA helicase